MQKAEIKRIGDYLKDLEEGLYVGEKMTEKQKVQFRKKWKGWLEKIGNDLGWLLTSRDIFERVRNIVDSNKRIQSPDLFHRWIIDNYVARVAIGIGRLNDHDSRTISLHRLIKDISENREAITRDYFVSRYDKWLQDKGLADHDFDNFAEKNDKLISLDRLNDDIDLLDKETRLVKDFRNRWIAHFDLNREVERVPTFEDVDKSLQVIDCIFCKYYLLVDGGGMNTRKPVIQYDWEEPLRYAWIEVDEQKQ